MKRIIFLILVIFTMSSCTTLYLKGSLDDKNIYSVAREFIKTLEDIEQLKVNMNEDI